MKGLKQVDGCLVQSRGRLDLAVKQGLYLSMAVCSALLWAGDAHQSDGF